MQNQGLRWRGGMRRCIQDLMTTDVIPIESGALLSEAYAILTEHHFRHLVVSNDDGLAGIATGD